MDERRDPEPAAGSRLRALPGVGRLSPVQEAWSAYVGHTTGCPTCRSIDGRCGKSERLYKAWQEQDADAIRRLRQA
ncbi:MULTISPECIES: hypothetical protein [unclassified Streptomyces]|uniref:hypothetical protein n=1 Tax=unclassified Streptomyces TaxID=2593676 RepID=UPI001488E5DE|nr:MULTISPECIES: hypothetical protein [unclassified Streptomyces]